MMGSSVKKLKSDRPPTRAQMAGHPGTLRRCEFRYLMPKDLAFIVQQAYHTPGIPLYGMKQHMSLPLQIVVPL